MALILTVLVTLIYSSNVQILVYTQGVGERAIGGSRPLMRSVLLQSASHTAPRLPVPALLTSAWPMFAVSRTVLINLGLLLVFACPNIKIGRASCRERV